MPSELIRKQLMDLPEELRQRVFDVLMARAQYPYVVPQLQIAMEALQGIKDADPVTSAHTMRQTATHALQRIKEMK